MAIKKYEKNNQTFFQVYINVRSKKRQSLRSQRKVSGIKTEKEAKKREKELLRECEREIFEKESSGETWGNLVDAWDEYLFEEGRLQKTTCMDYISAIKKHTHSWRLRPASSITVADVREVLNRLKQNSSSIAYQNTVKVILNRVFLFGIENRLIKGMERSPTFGISLGREEEKKPEILKIDEIKRLLENASKLNHPWYPVWAMALLTGLRNGELYALLWEDIDWKNKTISITKSYNARRRLVKSTKSGYWRTVPISSELEKLLREVKLQTGSQREILPRLPSWNKGEQARILRQFCLGIGLPSVKFHTLRACFATQLIRNGVPPIQIQKICGWKDLETMQRYVRLAGIETEGATESLKVLPDSEATSKAEGFFAPS